MCGIAGFIGDRDSDSEQAESVLLRMCRSLDHRGPDSSGTWQDSDTGIGFAHTRLAILDISPAGAQPMRSASGRFVITYNGEIYNHLALREALSQSGLPITWAGHSDTETLLAAIEAWGVRRTLERIEGMFAFALWDRREKVLTLARDRLGEKPLYYGRQDSGPFLFASELGAMEQHPRFRREVDRSSLCLFLRHGYISAPFSIFRGIRKLEPGCFLTLGSGDGEPFVERYWSAMDTAMDGAANRQSGSDSEFTDELERTLEAVIGRQMLSDVPLGAFLSGGVDSSAVVALMQKQSRRPVKTFSIGFHEQGFDEAKHARDVARHLGTDHTDLYVTPEQARAVIPCLTSIYDEPFADSSQIPTFLLSSLAREQVTVSLSGDGGDEMFGGYNRYLLTSQLWRRISRLPSSLRALLSSTLAAVPPTAWTALGDAAGRALPRFARVNRLGGKVHKGARLIKSDSLAELYSGMLSVWDDPGSLVLEADEPAPVADRDAAFARLGPVEGMMALDSVGYLPDDILVKVDRASMAVSLESRIPFLDRNVVEFAWRLPFDLKVRNGESKWILRQLLYRYVPKELIERPKMGFDVPIGHWLRGPLRDWAEDLLSQHRLESQGFLRPAPIRREWRTHLSGRVDASARLWPVLMFQNWLGPD